MRDVSESPARPRDAYGATLQQLARRHAVSVRPEVLDAARPPGCPTPTVDDRVPAPVARWAAAHAAAHVKLKHEAVVPPSAKVARIATYAVLLLLLLLVVLGVVNRDTFVLGLTLAVLATATLWSLANRAIAANLRLAEAAADDLTARWGFPVTDEVAAYLEAHERGLLRNIEFFRIAPRPSGRVAIRRTKPRG